MTRKARHILLLQGPLGPFFADLSDALHDEASRLGIELVTHKINFNKGDWHYAKADQVVNYHGKPADWQAWLTQYVQGHEIDTVLLYGDSRYYHRIAREVCKQLGVRLYACEEGYVRPGYVTFEAGGNNANSSFPAKFVAGELPEKEIPEPYVVGGVFRFQFWFATLYYVVRGWRFAGFWHYQHHRRGNWVREMIAWIAGGAKKQLWTRWREAGLTEKLVGAYAGKIFVVPLQVSVDSQIIHHSSYHNMEEFMDDVLSSFAANAPADAHLLIKHHPMDRGFHHYGAIIHKAIARLGLEGRVTYAYDVDLGALFQVAAGCVTVNSTVGLMAVEQGVPTLALGKSMMRDVGLGSALSLHRFWCSREVADQSQVQIFKKLLVAHTQVPGSFYKERHVAAATVAKRLLCT